MWDAVWHKLSVYLSANWDMPRVVVNLPPSADMDYMADFRRVKVPPPSEYPPTFFQYLPEELR